MDTAGFKRGAGAPPQDTLNTGNVNGKNWIPAECDVSIRPGWFYHKSEDSKVKTPEQLFDLYLKSVGRGANLLLNVPPDRRGLINEKDSAALVGFRKSMDNNFKSDLLKNETINILTHNAIKGTERLNDDNDSTFEFMNFEYQSNSFLCAFKNEKKINTIILKEFLQMGQGIKKFRIVLVDTKGKKKEIVGTTIGRQTIITFPTINTTYLGFEVLEDKGFSILTEIKAYLIDERLVER